MDKRKEAHSTGHSMNADSPHHLPAGTVLHDRYITGKAMGMGGFGITYSGFDPVLQRKVAIKEYYPVERCTRNVQSGLSTVLFAGVPIQEYERGKNKFLYEARILAKMDKQKVIVDVRDYFEENNTAYIVMEHIDGTTFTDLVRKKGGRIPPAELFSLVRPLFGALSSLHAAGLIHRDICPDNLMLENGHVRLLDFGSARETARLETTLSITLRHGYAPIEQYQQGSGQGPWTDVYALCATLYYCLTGVTPPLSTNRIVRDTLQTLSSLDIPVSRKRERAVLRGMHLRPHRRFQDMHALYNALYRSDSVRYRMKNR